MIRSPYSIWTLALASLALAAGVHAQEKLPPGAKVVKVEVRPERVEIKTPFEYRQLLITGVLATGERVDLTRMAKLDAPPVVKISDAGQVRPASDGKGEIQASMLPGKRARSRWRSAGKRPRPRSASSRMSCPSLSRVGCNAGTCHGSAQGKNGFQLSLRGYDPLFDHRALVDDIGGRRFNRAAPERSLMLMKPTGVVPHVGGVLTQPGEPYYEMLRSWIAQGVKLDLKTPRVTKIEVYPTSTQSFRCRA